MAVNLLNRIRELFKAPEQMQKIKEQIPFVHLFGFEKTYGAPHPQDYKRMVENYKSWAYACAWKNATSVAKADLCLYKRIRKADQDEELKKIYDHPFLKLIKQINPFSNKFEMMTITDIFLELTGNAYWWVVKDNLGIPQMIWNIPSHWTKVVPSKDQFISGYVVQVPGQGKFLPFDENEVIHFKFPSPFNMFYGTGPMFAGGESMDLHTKMHEWGINYFDNNANPGGILTTEQSISGDSFQRLKDQWNERHRGTKNAGRMAILDQGLKYEQTGSTVRDARLDNLSSENRDEILAMFGVPASKLGLESHDNRATAEASDYTYQSETIYPRLKLIEEKLNEKLIPMYLDGRDDLVCKFENGIPEDKEFRLKEKQVNISSGITTIDEERAEEGLEPFNLPETTKPLISFGLVPAGTPKEEPQVYDEEKSMTKASRHDAKWEVFANVSAPQERLLTEVMRRFFEDQKSEVMRNINKLRDFEPLKKDIWGYIMFNINQSNQKLSKMITPNIRNAFMSGLTLGMKDTNHPIDFNLFEPNIVRATESRARYVSELINKNTADLLKTELEEALTNGETLSEITKRIEKIYNFNDGFRSKRIAQTEVIGSINEGQLKSYTEAGIKKKVWITARDEKVRESHQIDGQVKEITESFISGDGGHLQYPGDRSQGASAGDTINCRCTVDPVFK